MKTISNEQCAMCNDSQPRKMKDSGIDWIGEIPEGWEVSKIKYHLKWKSEKGYPTEQVLSLYRDYGIIPKNSRDDNHNVTSLDTSGYKLVDKGDFVINKMKAWQGSMAVSGFRGIISPAYHVCEFTSESIYRKYFHYLMRNISYLPEYERLSTGMRIGQWDLQYDDFKNIPFLLPCFTEQQAIAAHLDRICSEIDSVTAKIKATIEEYKKLKQAVITEAVTKGIHKSRKMKDSGVEWIGEIPEDISISRVGLHFDIILGKMLCNTPKDDTYTYENYYCAANVHFDGLSDGELKQMWFNNVEKEQYKVNEGDLLVVEGGAGAGGCCIVPNCKNDVYIQNSIMIVRGKNSNSVNYLRYLIECYVKKGYIDYVCNKATIPHFTKDKLTQVPYPVFSYSEQQEIAAFLDEKCAAIDTLIAKKEQLLTELENYKKSVIYEYVTGKKEILI